MATLYQWPLLVEQERGLLDVVKKSALLEIDNFPATVVTGVLWGLLATVSWVLRTPRVPSLAGAGRVPATRALRETLPRYGLLPVNAAPDAADDAAPWKPGWHE